MLLLSSSLLRERRRRDRRGSPQFQCPSRGHGFSSALGDANGAGLLELLIDGVQRGEVRVCGLKGGGRRDRSTEEEGNENETRTPQNHDDDGMNGSSMREGGSSAADG